MSDGGTGAKTSGDFEADDVATTQRGRRKDSPTKGRNHNRGEEGFLIEKRNNLSNQFFQVQLSNIQKKYYRAILERNFTHLLKGNNVPSLMNIMMELRKCCNHPFLIKGAEEQIVSEMKVLHPNKTEDEAQFSALVQASGKMVLVDKLLPKLLQDGHKVLIFSQMVRVLDILEEFLNCMK